jgi:peroxiredoxin
MKFFVSLIFTLIAGCSALVYAQQASLIGKQPYFKLHTVEGKPIDTADLRGKYVVVNLWFINCPNCIEEIKQLNTLVDEYRGNNDVVFLGLAASPQNDVEKFLVKNPFKYQVLPDAQMIILSQFAVPNKQGDMEVPFPMHFVLDPYGRVIAEAQGIKGIGLVRSTLASRLAKP